MELVARDTREPSPFSHEILNANPYAFLDDAPLEERRARAVTLRRGLSFESASDLGRLDPEAIAQVRAEAWPLVRDAEELHDALHGMCLLRDDEAPEWTPQFEQLVAAGRATHVTVSSDENGRPKTEDANSSRSPVHPLTPSPLHPFQRRRHSPFPTPHSPFDFWTVAERWPLVKSLYPEAAAEPQIKLPDTVRQDWESAEAIVTLVRGRMQSSGPMTAERLGELLSLDPSQVFAALEAIEAEGTVMRGQFTDSVLGTVTSAIGHEPQNKVPTRITTATGSRLPNQLGDTLRPLLHVRQHRSNGASAGYWPAFTAKLWMACAGKFNRPSRPITSAFLCAMASSGTGHPLARPGRLAQGAHAIAGTGIGRRVLGTPHSSRAVR